MKTHLKTFPWLAILMLFLSLSACNEKKKQVVGTVEVAPQIQKALSPQAVLYIIARAAGETSGPPIAVKRFTQPLLFPLEFNISGQDAMIPDTPFEGQLTITARIAQTGSATPINAGDIEGSSKPNPVLVGTSDLKITLDQIHK